MTALLLLFVVAFLVALDTRVMGPVLPSIAASLASTSGIVGLALTSHAFAYGSGQLVYGPLSDRHGRIAVIRWAALAFAVSTMLSAASASVTQFVALRLLTGAFAGGLIPLTLAYIGDTYEYGERQAVLGRFSVATSAATALSAAVGGAVAHFVSWRAMLIGYGLVALVPIALMFRLDPGRPASALRPGEAAVTWADIITDRRGRQVYVAVFWEGFFLWGAVAYLSTFGVQRLGLDQFQVGLLMGLFGGGTMLGGPFIGRIRRRWSENMLAGTGGLLLGAALLALLPPWPWPVFGVAMLGLGLGFVALHTTLQLRGTEINPAARGKAFALFAFSLFTGSGVGVAVLGRLVDRGLAEIVLAGCAAGLVATGLGAARFDRGARA